MKDPKVDIILVNFNQPVVTRECLQSIQKAEFPNTGVWLVENGCEPDKMVDVNSFPFVRTIRSDRNLGFAGGNNLAIRESDADFILLLNNDTEVRGDLISELLETFKAYPSAGIVSPKVLFHGRDGLIQYAGTGNIDPILCRGKTRGYLEFDAGQYDEIVQTQLSHGACMMIRREVISTIGLLEESYFLYYEEYDFCEKAKRAGFDIYYNGNTAIYHKESVSTGRISPLKAYYMSRNRVRFALRNFTWFQGMTSLLFYYLLALPKKVLSELLNRRPANALAVVRGALNLPFRSVNG